MLLYQGTPYVKGNVFIDPKGAKLTFDKTTKKGKIFATENGLKVGLTEGQVNKLKLLNEFDIIKKRDEVPKVIGVTIKFDCFEEDLKILEKSLKNINYYGSDNQNHIIGFVCFDIKNVKLGSITLDFLKEYQKSGTLEVMLDDFTVDIFNVEWFHGIEKIQDDTYLLLFEGRKEQ